MLAVIETIHVQVISGHLLAQQVDVIVNAWHPNVLPWWLPNSHPATSTIKQQAGPEPFRQLSRHGALHRGQAVLTGAGTLPYRGIIHVACVNAFGRATEESVRYSVINAMQIVNQQGFTSVAFPALGIGMGGFSQGRAIGIMRHELKAISSPAHVIIAQEATS